MTSPAYNPGQPFIQYISGGFSPGKIAHITGSFIPYASSIMIKLQTGPHGDPSDDIGLCLYGRHAESRLVYNFYTKKYGWSQGEFKPTRFLVAGCNFDITILCDLIHFKIAVNREHFLEFKHQMDPSCLTYLNVSSGPNDISLSCVWVEGQSAPNLLNPSGLPPVPSQQPSQYGPSISEHGSSTAPQHADHYGSKNKGLMGMVSSAGAAVAGALGASHLLGSKGHTYGYPYPASSHQGYGHSNSMGGSIANKAMALGGGVVAAKAMKKGLGGGKLLKYGLPLAGVGLGGYALSKGLSNSFDFDDEDDFYGGCCSDSD